MTDYKIISTGSKGNCVKIGEVLFDCGVAYSKIKDELYDVKVLIITHIHQDHLKQQTLLSIMENFPHIEIIGNYEVYQQIPVVTIANAGFEVEAKGYRFMPFECEHDVLTYGYTWQVDGIDFIYCTDTGSLDNAPDKKYDYLFLESNHDEKKLQMAIGQKKGSYDPYLSGKRHLSTQACKNFYYLHRKSRESVLVELHMSNRFY
jgi:hypothetical protein